MAALESADDYRGVAEHLLASEALEPGHGWAYSVLNIADDAVGFAKNVVEAEMSEA